MQPYLEYADHAIAQIGRNSIIFIVNGISTEQLEFTFGRFQQVNVSDSRRGEAQVGISRLQQYGGKIRAESVLNKRSTFYFTLPL